MAKSVILYSGGMDSFCLSHLYPEADLLFIRTGTKDNKFEEPLLPAKTLITELPLVQWELNNKIIPFRNAFFVLIAAQRYSKIYLGATIGDTTKDKDYVFKAQMEGMLNYFGMDYAKNGHSERPFEVLMPFKGMTKSRILEQYIRNGGNMTTLQTSSRSCYEGVNQKECGRCRSCLRKWIAFHNNSMDLFLEFSHIPTRAELFEFLKESIEKGRHPEEITEIKRALL